MSIGVKQVEWNGAKQQEAVDILLSQGRMIVSPTKGWIHHHDIRLWRTETEVLRKAARTQQAGCCSMQFNAAATPASPDER